MQSTSESERKERRLRKVASHISESLRKSRQAAHNLQEIFGTARDAENLQSPNPELLEQINRYNDLVTYQAELTKNLHLQIRDALKEFRGANVRSANPAENHGIKVEEQARGRAATQQQNSAPPLASFSNLDNQPATTMQRGLNPAVANTTIKMEDDDNCDPYMWPPETNTSGMLQPGQTLRNGPPDAHAGLMENLKTELLFAYITPRRFGPTRNAAFWQIQHDIHTALANGERFTDEGFRMTVILEEIFKVKGSGTDHINFVRGQGPPLRLAEIDAEMASLFGADFVALFRPNLITL